MSNGSSLSRVSCLSTPAATVLLVLCVILRPDFTLATGTFLNIPVSTTNVTMVPSNTNTVFTLIDTQGRIVFGDYNLLKRVGTDGQTTTIADVDALGASGFVQGIAEDSAGNYFLAAGNLYAVPKVDSTSGVCTKYAGTLTTGLSDGPIATSKVGNVVDIVYNAHTNAFFLLEADFNTIRKIDVATATLSTVITSTQPWSMGFAVTSDATTMYLTALGSSSYTSALYKVDVQAGTMAIVAGSESDSASVDGIGTNARFVSITWTALNGDESVLVISDYLDGLRYMNIATSEVGRLLLPEPDFAVLGGLQYYCNGTICGYN